MEVQAALKSKTWFGFDLHDTLHEFRKASSAASLKVFREISTTSDIPVVELKKCYADILKRATLAAFSDGRTSSEYRKERFATLLDEFSVPVDPVFLDKLAETYKIALQRSLQLKAGALELLTHLQRMGKKIVIITEGPQDAQEWTVQQLEIASRIDFLATTNFFCKSKVDRLFPAVLDHLGISGHDMAFVGDSLERDMIPAAKLGVYTVHYAEGEEVSLDTTPVRINALEELEIMLS